jgi:hypothetical protein
MDDFNLSTLTESRNEYCALLLSKITPSVIQGIYSIFNEAWKLCDDNDEQEKYLMTFQNFLARVTKWSQEIVDNETNRIIQNSGCSYLEDLLTCVHITQLKLLTSVRVGQKQKKIDIDIPKLSTFIHKIYIQVARKVYKNVFLFDKQIAPLQQQKNLRELEIIVKECILGVIRDSMPLETILRSYLDETQEDDVEEVVEEVREEVREVEDDGKQQGGDLSSSMETKPVPEPEKQVDDIVKEVDQLELKIKEDAMKLQTDTLNIQNDANVDTLNIESFEDNKTQDGGNSGSSQNITMTIDTTSDKTVNNDTNSDEIPKLTFNDSDAIVKYDKLESSTKATPNVAENVVVPKTVENLEKISEQRWAQRAEDDDSDDEDDAPLKFLDDISKEVKTDILGIQDLTPLQSKPANNNSLLDQDVIELI